MVDIIAVDAWATRHDVIRQADEMMYLVKNTTRDNIGIAQRGVMK